jgi:GGDEF domain-containing protein
MNRSPHQTHPRLILASLTAAPTHPILIQMLNLAQKNFGQIVSLSWQQPPDPNTYTLETCVIESASSLLGRKTSAAAQLRWAFYRNIDQEKQVIWTHETNDVDLILNLVLTESVSVTKPQSQEEPGRKTKFGMAAQVRRTGRAAALKATAFPSASGKGKNDATNATTLAGNLNEIELTGVLQSINICKMSGRLDLQDRLNSTEIYFDEGQVVHAISQKALNTENDKPIIGDQAVLDVLTWEKGTFFFYPSRRTSEKTIKRRLEGLLLEGASLRDYNDYLRQAEITFDSCLYKLSDGLNETELGEKLMAGVPIDLATQKNFYKAIDSKSPISAIVERLGLNRASWTPIVFNLITCELVTSDSTVKDKKETRPDAIKIDRKAVSQAAHELVRAETGFCVYPLFIHFLELELARYKRSEMPFAIAIFDINNKNGSLSNNALRKIAECFASVGEPFDMLGHFGVFEFAMILPLREDHECRDFVEGFAKLLARTTLDGVKNPDDLHVTFGIASVPFDAQDLQELLCAASKAKKIASEEKRLCITARELRWDEYRASGEQALKDQDYVAAEEHWSAAFSEAQVFAHDDERLLTSAERLSTVLKQRGKNADAEPLLTSLVQIKTRIHGANSIEVAQAAGELAHCYYLLGKYNDAEPLLKRLLEIYCQELGEEHPIAATWLYHLATLYHVQQKFDLAQTAYKRALSASNAAWGAEHPTTLKAQANYNNLIKSMNPKIEQIDQSLITGSWRPIRSTTDESEQQLLEIS